MRENSRDGVGVVDPLIRKAEEIIEEKCRRKERGHHDKKAFVDSLVQKGFPILGVFPPLTWKSICGEMGLFVFRNMDAAGTVPVNPAMNYGFVSKLALASFYALMLGMISGVGCYFNGWMPLAISAAVASSVALYYGVKFDNLGAVIPSFAILAALSFYQIVPHSLYSWETVWSLFGAYVAAAAGLAMIMFLGGGAMLGPKLIGRWLGYIATAYNSRLSNNKLIEKLWPEKIDSFWDNSVRAFVKLPVDEEFERLRKMALKRGLKAVVVAEKRAIAVDPSEISTVYKEREKMMPTLQAEPVLFIEGSWHVAIIRRCGDFEDEGEFLDAVMRAEV